MRTKTAFLAAALAAVFAPLHAQPGAALPAPGFHHLHLNSMKAGKSVDETTAAFTVDKYPGYKNERVKAAVQAVYDELKK